MKKYLMVLLTLVGLMIFTSSAWCDPITSATYGGVDKLIAYDAVNSGDAEELAWVNLKTGMAYTEMVKYTPTYPDIWPWQETADTGILAIDFKTVDPAYFFVKLGNIAPGYKGDVVVPDHFLYENMSSLAWGVINMAEIETKVEELLGEGINIEAILIGKISHTGELGGGTEVPEPATLILLGLGLLGIAGIRRKK